MKKYILFDNDGVLVHTEPLYFKANIKALKEYFDVSLEFEEYMKIMSEGTTVWQKALDKGFSLKEIEILLENKKRDSFRYTAPPQGLFLYQVFY